MRVAPYGLFPHHMPEAFEFRGIVKLLGQTGLSPYESLGRNSLEEAHHFLHPGNASEAITQIKILHQGYLSAPESSATSLFGQIHYLFAGLRLMQATGELSQEGGAKESELSAELRKLSSDLAPLDFSIPQRRRSIALYQQRVTQLEESCFHPRGRPSISGGPQQGKLVIRSRVSALLDMLDLSFPPSVKAPDPFQVLASHVAGESKSQAESPEQRLRRETKAKNLSPPSPWSLSPRSSLTYLLDQRVRKDLGIYQPIPLIGPLIDRWHLFSADVHPQDLQRTTAHRHRALAPVAYRYHRDHLLNLLKEIKKSP